MISSLGGIIDTVSEFFQALLQQISIDILLYVFAGIMLAIVLIGSVRLFWAYENRAMRAIRKINKYLVKNPTVTEENLVEFHSKMKKLPQRIRDRWQLFMLEREGSPSRYLTIEYCVKRPLYNSSILQFANQNKLATLIVAVLAFVFSLSYLIANNVIGGLPDLLAQSVVVPAVVIVIGTIYTMVLEARYNYLNHDFYDTFAIFIRNIDKATNTMPDYVDYELLFTPKEINNGIPILREYLEKRALEEQRLLEKSKRDSVDHSPYNFEDLGVNGEQLIERAVTESEQFLLNKINLQNEIIDLEKQYQKTEQNMEDIQREANRKLQTIKENLERLDKAMNETTNRVEINYNRRQAKDEMDKKLLLEKDLQSMLQKEKVAQDALQIEIQKRKELIEQNKAKVEDSLKSEYNTFATKVYHELNEKLTESSAQTMHDYEMQVARLKAKLKEVTRDVEKKDAVIEARNLELDNLKLYYSKKSEEEDRKKGKKGKKNEPAAPVSPQVEAPAPNLEPEPAVTVTEEAAEEPAPQSVEEYSAVPAPEPQNVGTEAQNASHINYNPDEANLIDPNQGIETGNETNDFSQYYDENGNMIDYSMYYDENGNPIDLSQYYDENGNLKPEYAHLADGGDDTTDGTDGGAMTMNEQPAEPAAVPTEPVGSPVAEETSSPAPEFPTQNDSGAVNDAAAPIAHTPQGGQQEVSAENNEYMTTTPSAEETQGSRQEINQAYENTEQPSQQSGGLSKMGSTSGNFFQAISAEDLYNLASDTSQNAPANTQAQDAAENEENTAPDAPVNTEESSPENPSEQNTENTPSEEENAQSTPSNTPPAAPTNTGVKLSIEQPYLWATEGKKEEDETDTAETEEIEKVLDQEYDKGKKDSETPEEKKEEPKAEELKEEQKEQKEDKESAKPSDKEKADKEDKKEEEKPKKASQTKLKSAKSSFKPKTVAAKKPSAKKSEDKEEKEEKAEEKQPKAKEEKSASKKVQDDTDDLLKLQKQIEEENARLKQQQEELRSQIDETLSAMEKKSNATKTERAKQIKKIKEFIDQLKIEAKEAKARGASKQEISKINSSVAELLKVIADYQINKK